MPHYSFKLDHNVPVTALMIDDEAAYQHAVILASRYFEEHGPLTGSLACETTVANEGGDIVCTLYSVAD